MRNLFVFLSDFYGRFNKIATILILLFSFLVSIAIIFIFKIDKDIINLISVVLSIIIGLMFNFFASLSNNISSEHLSIKYKFKEIRLDKLEASYKSSYFSIYISILCLLICLVLIAMSSSEKTIPQKNDYIVKIITVTLIFLLIQMFLSFYYVLNDMKNFVDYDIKQERKIIQKKRLKEMNEND